MKREPVAAGVALTPVRRFGFCPKCERWGRVDVYGDRLRPHKGSRRCLRGELAALRREVEALRVRLAG